MKTKLSSTFANDLIKIKKNRKMFIVADLVSLMSDFRLYDGSDFKTYLLIRWYGPDALAVVRPRFLLLQYS